MVVAPGEWEPGINCEGELREFSGGDGAAGYPDGALSCIGVCPVKHHPVVHLRCVHFIERTESKVSIPDYLRLAIQCPIPCHLHCPKTP